MSSVRSLSIFLTIATILSFSVTGISVAQDDDIDLSAITCKEVMRTSGADRDSVMALMQGYVLGKKGATKFNSTKLANVSDEFVEHCLDNPTDKALDTLGKIAK